jgi:hypothetical protein
MERIQALIFRRSSNRCLTDRLFASGAGSDCIPGSLESVGVIGHVPVLLEEAVDQLAIKSDGVYLDGTFGRGGHSAAILRQLGSGGRLFAMDRDPEAASVGLDLANREPRFTFEQESLGVCKLL